MAHAARHAPTPTRRDPLSLLLIIVAVAALAVAIVGIVSTDAHAVQSPRALATAVKADPAHSTYNNLGRWPVDNPQLCIEDRTYGFPVKQAAAEFADYVRMDVRDDCTGHEFVVRVITINDPRGEWNGEVFTAWFTSGRTEAQIQAGEPFERGTILLNLARGYQMTPAYWELAIAHELGHALGLEHPAPGVHSLMDPTVDKYGVVDGLTRSDRHQLKEIYGGSR